MHYEMLTKQSLFVRKTIIFAAEPIVPKYIRQPRCFNELKGHVRARLELQNCLSLSLSLSLLFSRFSLSLSLSSSSILFLGPKLRDRFSLWTDTHTVCTRLVLLHQGRLHEVMLTHLKFLYFIVEEIKRARFFLFFFLFFSFHSSFPESLLGTDYGMLLRTFNKREESKVLKVSLNFCFLSLKKTRFSLRVSLQLILRKRIQKRFVFKRDSNGSARFFFWKKIFLKSKKREEKKVGEFT